MQATLKIILADSRGRGQLATDPPQPPLFPPRQTLNSSTNAERALASADKNDKVETSIANGKSQARNVNIEHPTSNGEPKKRNAEHSPSGLFLCRSMFGVQCSMFDVRVLFPCLLTPDFRSNFSFQLSAFLPPPMPRNLTASPDTGHRTPDTGHRTPDTGHRTPDTGHRTPDTGHRTPDTGHRTPDTGPARVVASRAGSSPASSHSSGGLCPSQAARAARRRPPPAGAWLAVARRGRRRRAGGSVWEDRDGGASASRRLWPASCRALLLWKFPSLPPMHRIVAALYEYFSPAGKVGVAAEARSPALTIPTSAVIDRRYNASLSSALFCR